MVVPLVPYGQPGKRYSNGIADKAHAILLV